MGMDLSYLEALMGSGAENSGGAEEPGGERSGVWVVDPAGTLDDGILRLLGKARVVADVLGAYVYLLSGGEITAEQAQPALGAGADRVVLGRGVPDVPALAGYFTERAPQVVLFPHTYLGRMLGPGLAQRLGGGLVALAADLSLDPYSRRLVAYQPLLDDAARQAITILAAPAVAVVDTEALPAAFSEPWRSGQVEEAGLSWPAAVEYPAAGLPPTPLSLADARVVVGAGRALKDAAGFALAERLAAALGGVAAGDVSALDAGWIGEDRLVDLTGQSIAPGLYLALGIDGDSSHLMAVQQAQMIVAVQPDPSAPIVQVADWNVLADPAEFARALLGRLAA